MESAAPRRTINFLPMALDGLGVTDDCGFALSMKSITASIARFLAQVQQYGLAARIADFLKVPSPPIQCVGGRGFPSQAEEPDRRQRGALWARH